MAEKYCSNWRDIQNLAFAQGWMDAGGIRTRYLQAGDPTNPPLLFLHGTGGHAEAYIRNLTAHAAKYNVWAIDMIGHGWSDKGNGPLEIKHYVDHIIRWMDALNFSTIAVSGESLGGWVTAKLAVEHPERIERIVLNTAGGMRADQEVMKKIIEVSVAAADDPTWERIKARLEWLMADPASVNDDMVATRQAIYQQSGMDSAIRHGLALQNMEIRQRNLITREEYMRIACPTMVLWTSHDPTADVPHGREMAAAIPGSKFVVMNGCGHWPQFEDPDTFNRIHLAFLQDDSIPEAE